MSDYLGRHRTLFDTNNGILPLCYCDQCRIRQRITDMVELDRLLAPLDVTSFPPRHLAGS